MPLTIEDGRLSLSFDFRVTVHADNQFPAEAAQDCIAKSLAHPTLSWTGGGSASRTWAEAVAFSAIEAEAACLRNGLGALRVNAAMEPSPGAFEDWRLECSVEIVDPALFVAQAQSRYEDCWFSPSEELSIEELGYELLCASNTRPYSPIDAGFEFTRPPEPATTLEQLCALQESRELSEATRRTGLSQKNTGRPRV